MREVEVTRFVGVPPAAVERALSPARIVEYEESFRVEDATETDGGWTVTVAGGGLRFRLRFETREDGYAYEQEEGPLETMERIVTCVPSSSGRQASVVSIVSSGPSSCS
jgi:hypothetical protein